MRRGLSAICHRKLFLSCDPLPPALRLPHHFSIDSFCRAPGLELLDTYKGGYTTICRRTQAVEPDWSRLRAMEHRSQQLSPRRELKDSHRNPYGLLARLAVTQTLRYPRKLTCVLRGTL
jgi:hypothetical protein